MQEAKGRGELEVRCRRTPRARDRMELLEARCRRGPARISSPG